MDRRRRGVDDDPEPPNVRIAAGDELVDRASVRDVDLHAEAFPPDALELRHKSIGPSGAAPIGDDRREAIGRRRLRQIARPMPAATADDDGDPRPSPARSRFRRTRWPRAPGPCPSRTGRSSSTGSRSARRARATALGRACGHVPCDGQGVIDPDRVQELEAWDTQTAPSPGSSVPISVDRNDAPSIPWTTMSLNGVASAKARSTWRRLSSPVSSTNRGRRPRDLAYDSSPCRRPGSPRRCWRRPVRSSAAVPGQAHRAEPEACTDAGEHHPIAGLELARGDGVRQRDRRSTRRRCCRSPGRS